MKEPEWLLREVVLAVHKQLLARFGGLPGVRDDGLLDSALAKPPSLFTYSNPSLFELAASYGYGIIQNHPFVDGNKRTGFLAAVIFLDLNGCRLIADEVDAALASTASSRTNQEAK